MCGTRNSSLLVKITILVVICCFVLSAEGKYGGGTGEPNDPYQIRDANHMQAIGADANDWDKCFKLMADVDLSEFDGKDGRPKFNIIGERYYDAGFVEHPFTGVFDGNNHTISNFIYDSNDKNNIGLFGYVRGDNVEIKNLELIDAEVDAGAGGYVGSLVGYLHTGTITNCCVEAGSVSGYYFLGGLVGRNEAGKISNCYAKGSFMGINSCIGGLVGCNYTDTTITNCYSTGQVTGENNIGGLVGHNASTITNCYSLSGVSGAHNDVGGLVGDNEEYGVITNCYSTGIVFGANDVGGLVGENNGAVSYSYWDIDASGAPNMCGGQYEGATGCEPKCGKTTVEMMQQSTFEEWDFINVWNIGENQTYPYLRTYLAGDINKDGIVNFKDLGFLALHWLENYGAEKLPQVQITYPEDGARLMVGGVPPQTMIMAEANDYDGIVVRVEFFANDLKLGEDPDGSDGWNYLWQEYSLGRHVLTATAWDNEGLSGTSSPVNVEVWMPDPPPP